MASKKFEELNAMSVEELQGELQETEKYLTKLRFDHAIKGLANPLVLREVRRDIARVHTELTRREIANMSKAELAKRSQYRKRRRAK